MTIKNKIIKLEDAILNAEIAIEEAKKQIKSLHNQKMIKVGTIWKNTKNKNIYTLTIISNFIVFMNITNHNTYVNKLVRYEFKCHNRDNYYQITAQDFNWIVRGQTTFYQIDDNNLFKKEV